MIWFEELQTRKKISRIFSSYEKTFPEDERRDEAQFFALLEHPASFIFSVKNEETSVGYIILWELNDFYFVEHFEVFEEFRNLKLGSQILAELEAKFGQIILESEPSSLNELAARRIQFYLRNGYTVISRDYLQPSYGAGKNPLQLYLLSNYEVADLAHTIEILQSTVYRLSN